MTKNIADIIIDTCQVMTKAYRHTQNPYLKARIVDTYYRVVENTYPNDQNKQITYKKLFHTKGGK